LQASGDCGGAAEKHGNSGDQFMANGISSPCPIMLFSKCGLPFFSNRGLPNYNFDDAAAVVAQSSGEYPRSAIMP
jgi:hypothetical protein